MDEINSFTRRRLPLGALRAFEAAARLESFRLAADELGVTPTAISHRIRELEETLGLKLFERHVRRVALTPSGRRLFPVLRDGFDAFAEALRTLRPDDGGKTVTLSVLVAFAAHLLLPRMADFRKAHPDLQLRLHASDDPVDLRSGAADLAIRYGYGPFPGLVAEPLFVESFAPVCSPKLALASPGDLRDQPLLHAEWRHPAADTPTWARWAQVSGLADLDTTPRLTFTDDSQAIQAAVAGLGVAMASLSLVRAELASGLLIQPFETVIQGRPYHLLRLPTASPAVIAVHDWLLAELKA
ncbi:LysR substrate-binding domain-containing protein [Caulobacter sp. 1776]|uniref:LysR substrate-binding domain-containing protein n=1 Tax=Caulobacter sp. 1776 TaxID=3156420 RepID=UPI003399D547